MKHQYKFLKINNQIVYAISETKGVVVNNHMDFENELCRRVYGGKKVTESDLEEIAVEIGERLEYVDFTAKEVDQVANNFDEIYLDDYSSS